MLNRDSLKIYRFVKIFQQFKCCVVVLKVVLLWTFFAFMIWSLSWHIWDLIPGHFCLYKPSYSALWSPHFSADHSSNSFHAEFPQQRPSMQKHHFLSNENKNPKACALAPQEIRTVIKKEIKKCTNWNYMAMWSNYHLAVGLPSGLSGTTHQIMFFSPWQANFIIYRR